ncbi:MAG: TetR/AcrR family transcriptional regulator [Pseudomonadota bacterium]
MAAGGNHETGETRRRPYHHGDLRAELLDVVRELIEEHGPDGFSVAEAARKAGVSTGAPYRHFRDRAELLEAVVMDALDRLRASMKAGRDRYPEASLEAICGTGMGYIEFARAEPGIFRVMFSLTEGHEDNPKIRSKGEETFAVVVEAAARYLRMDPSDMFVRHRAYMLWTFVHGHSFLMIDKKTVATEKSPPEWDFLMDAARGVLDGPRPS